MRTSQRPKAFSNVLHSIINQKNPDGTPFTDFNLLLHVDSDETFEYVNSFMADYNNEHEVLKLQNMVRRKEPLPRDHEKRFIWDPNIGFEFYHAPYNLYENALMELVQDGFIMYLDDDDLFVHDLALFTISNEFKHQADCLLLWRVNIQGNLVPESEYWMNPPEITHISGIGFAFPVKYKNVFKWDEFSCSDYRIAKKLWDTIKLKVFIDEALTRTQKVGYGDRKDIS